MTPDIKACIYHNEISFIMEPFIYTVKTRAFTKLEDYEDDAPLDTENVWIEVETSYRPIEQQSSCHKRGTVIEREIANHAVIGITHEDLAGIYSAFMGKTIGKVSVEKLRLTASKQAMYLNLHANQKLIEQVAMDKQARRELCQRIIQNDNQADWLLMSILTGCVLEIHERYHDVKDV